MLFNGLDYIIGNRECLFLDHLQGFFGIGSEQIIQDQIMQLQSSSAWIKDDSFIWINRNWENFLLQKQIMDILVGYSGATMH